MKFQAEKKREWTNANLQILLLLYLVTCFNVYSSPDLSKQFFNLDDFAKMIAGHIFQITRLLGVQKWDRLKNSYRFQSDS